MQKQNHEWNVVETSILQSVLLSFFPHILNFAFLICTQVYILIWWRPSSSANWIYYNFVTSLNLNLVFFFVFVFVFFPWRPKVLCP